MLYLIENVEEEIENWCLLEYQHICETVGAKNAIFTSIPPESKKDWERRCRIEYFNSFPSKPLSCARSTVSLLQMDAEEELKVEDSAKFDAILIGGILGNVPSDDRTSEVRRLRPCHSRHLGPLQMTTNTAVLVSKMILEDKVPLSEIPIVDEPEIFAEPGSKESIILPFRYVAKSYLTKREEDRNTPILPEGLLKFLIDSADSSLL
ncbi:hypothetical protein Esti_003305 [Eimeria stiedai]